MQVVTCRCHGVHLRTWYWSRPSRSLPWALFSSIFQRIPATAINSGIGVGSGAWARKNSSSVGLATERRIRRVWPYPAAGGWSDPNPQVSVESIFGLTWRSFRVVFWVARRPRARVAPRVAGLRWCRGRWAGSGRRGQGADAGEDLVEQVVSRWWG